MGKVAYSVITYSAVSPCAVLAASSPMQTPRSRERATIQSPNRRRSRS